MEPLNALRLALEAAVAAPLALFAALTLARADWRRPIGFYLGFLSAGVAFACALNAATSAGLAQSFRALNYLVELSLWPALLALVTRAGDEGPIFRRRDIWVFVLPVLGAAVLASDAAFLADGFALSISAAFLIACSVQLNRRQPALHASGCASLVRDLVLLMGAAAVLRLWIVADAGIGLTYRNTYGYLGVLAVAFVLAARVFWAALRAPETFARRPNPAPSSPPQDFAALETAFLRLMDDGAFLEPCLSLADIAERLRAPARNVSRMTASRLGENVSAYLNRRRAERAAEALVSTNQAITTILYDSGFGSKSAFQREFRKRYGMSPSEYRDASRSRGQVGGKRIDRSSEGSN